MSSPRSPIRSPPTFAPSSRKSKRAASAACAASPARCPPAASRPPVVVIGATCRSPPSCGARHCPPPLFLYGLQQPPEHVALDLGPKPLLSGAKARSYALIAISAAVTWFLVRLASVTSR